MALPSVKELAPMMGADVGLQSESGKGSEFWFSICVPANEDKADSVVVEEWEVVAESSSEQLRILIAEDNGINQMFPWRCSLIGGCACGKRRRGGRSDYPRAIRPDFDGYSDAGAG